MAAMWVGSHFRPLYLSGIGLIHPDLILQHVHVLSLMRTNSLAFASLCSRAANINEVTHVAVVVEVGDKFLC